MTKPVFVYGVVSALLGAVILACVLMSTGWKLPGQESPDWTFFPCDAWANTSAPYLPPYTRTDGCVLPDGSIDWAPRAYVTTDHN